MFRASVFLKVLVIGCLIFGAVSFCYAANLFNDPGFENGVNNWDYAGYPFTATTSPVHGGTYAATDTITTLVNTQDFFGEVYQDIQSVSGGNPVYMEGWIKTNLAQGSTARGGIQVEFLNSSNTRIGDPIKTELSGVNDWFKIYVSGVAPAGTVKVRAGAYIFAQQNDLAAIGGSVYADDLFIDKIAAPGGLITNPGFESALSGWTTGVGSYPFASDTAQKHSGTYSASDAVNTVTSSDYYGFIYQTPSVSAGSPIYASAWAKSNISLYASAKGGLIIQFFNSSGVSLGELKSEIGGTTDWRQLYVSGTVPSGTATAKVGAYLYAAKGDSTAVGGKFYVDDFVVSTSYLPPPPPQTSLINADFENGVNDWIWQFRPFVASHAAYHGGSISALHMIGNTNDPNNDYFAWDYQDIPFSPGQTAYASGWVKTSFGTTLVASGGIKIGFYDSTGTLIPGSEVQQTLTGTKNWTQLFVYPVAPATTAKVRIGFFVWAKKNQGTPSKNVYVDDMTFSNTVPGGLIVNGGFESALSGWVTNITGDPMNSTTDEHYAGSVSAEATILQPSGTADYWSRLYQEFTVTTGQTVYATLWAKTNIPVLSMARAGLMVQFYDNAGIKVGEFIDSEGGQTNWSYEYVAAPVPTGAVKARVGPFVSASHNDAALLGYAYFDEVVASFSPLPQPTYPTVLTNTGFEQSFLGWQDLYGPPSTLDNTNPHGGVYSAKKTIVDITDADYFSTIYQDIYYNSSGAPFPSDRAVYLTGYVKSNINVASSAKGGIRLEYFDANDVAHEIGKEELSAVNDWRQFYITATIPAGAKKVRVSGFAFAPDGDAASIDGTINFDDFQYSYSYIAPPARQTILQNTDFENGINYWQDLNGLPSTLDNVSPRSGSYSVKKTIASIQNQDYYSIAYQDIYYNSSASPFPAAQDVYLTAYLKSNINPAANAAGGIKIEYFDSSNVAHQIGVDQVSAINNWRQLYVKANIPVGATKVRVSGFAWAKEGDALSVNGTVNFDDFVYSYTPLAAPPLPATLQNPGFENGLNDWDTPFKPAFVETSPSIVYNGNYAAGLSIDHTTGQAYYGQINQDVATVARKVVTAKAWAKTVINPASNAKASLYIVFFDAAGNFITMNSSIQQLGGNTNWTQLAVSATAPTNTARVQVRCELYASESDSTFGGIAYFDAATLSISSGGGCLLPGTKITLADGKLKAIEEIKKGDKVLGAQEDGKLVATEVTETFFHPKNEGFLVITTQDDRTLRLTANHPVRNHIDYVEAGSLKVGDEISILNNKKLTPTKIISIITDNSPVDVYNLEVSKTHNYFADGCLVHNKMPQRFMEDAGGSSGPR